MTFIEKRLLDEVSYGSQFGREFRTRIVQLKSGRERRNAEWTAPLGRYSLLYNAIRPEHHQQIIGAHAACFGALFAFRFKDWSDYRVEDEPLTTGTGSAQEVQLVKRYSFGPIEYVREIKKPVEDSVFVTVGGAPIPSSLDATTGLVTFTAPSGASVRWSGEFDVPVRFEDDRLDVTPIAPEAGGMVVTSNADLVEVRL